MLRIARILEPLTTTDRRAIALDVWRSFGGPLEDLRRLIERDRKAAARDRVDPPDDSVPELSLENPGNVPESHGQNGRVPPQTPPIATRIVFKIPESIRTALSKSRFLGSKAALARAEFWQAAIRAYPGVDYAHVILDAEAFLEASPRYKPTKRVSQFMLHQLRRAKERSEP